MIKGGVVSGGNSVELSISVAGGKNYKRVYNDVVNVAINKFDIISTTLSKLLVSKDSTADIDFYVDQMCELLQRAHVELIPGNMSFHKKYNMWLLDGYIRMLLETTDMKMISQLLDIDSILYSIEEAGFDQGSRILLEFQIPKSTKIKTIKDIDPANEITTPVAAELSAYIHSLDHNMELFVQLIKANQTCLMDIHKCIIDAASKNLKK